MVSPARAARLSLLWTVLLLPCCIAAQSKPTHLHTPVINLPRGTVTHILSPDRKWMLIFELIGDPLTEGCPGAEEVKRKLWIQRKGSSERKLVREFERSLDVSWSPDSRHFFINDASGSNGTLAYVYDTETLKVVDVQEMLAAASRGVRNFEADHFYVQAKHWVSPDALLVTVNGYLSSTPPTPGLSGSYTVHLNGVVRTIREGYWR